MYEEHEKKYRDALKKASNKINELVQEISGLKQRFP